MGIFSKHLTVTESNWTFIPKIESTQLKNLSNFEQTIKLVKVTLNISIRKSINLLPYLNDTHAVYYSMNGLDNLVAITFPSENHKFSSIKILAQHISMSDKEFCINFQNKYINLLYLLGWDSKVFLPPNNYHWIKKVALHGLRRKEEAVEQRNG